MSVKMVVGSYGSYNTNNGRALGSNWLNLQDYSSWNEILAELKNQGFKLDGIDEELFIQDIDGILLNFYDIEKVSPKEFFQICKESGILNNINNKQEIAEMYLECKSWNDFVDLVKDYGSDWDQDIMFYKDQTVEEVLENFIGDVDFTELGWLANYISINYEAMARDLDEYYEVSKGTLYIN